MPVVVLVLTLEVLSLARSLFCGDMAPKLMLFGRAISAGFPSTGPPGPSSFTLQGNKHLVSFRDSCTCKYVLKNKNNVHFIHTLLWDRVNLWGPIFRGLWVFCLSVGM